MILKTPISRHYEQLPTNTASGKLSLFFATFCVIDLFGVFPIVTLPKSIISCGYYALPLILLIFSLQTWTAVVLGRCWVIAERIDPAIVDKSRYAYAAIGELTYGKYMKYFVTFLLVCWVKKKMFSVDNFQLSEFGSRTWQCSVLVYLICLLHRKTSNFSDSGYRMEALTFHSAIGSLWLESS